MKKNIKNISLISALAIPAALVWYEVKHEAPTAQPAAPTLVPTALIAVQQQPIVPAATAAQPEPLPAVVIDTPAADGAIKHVAQPGETVTSLAANMLGKDSKTNRDAIINANASLQADPDKLMAGQAYHIPAPLSAQAPTPSEASSAVTAPPAAVAAIAAPQPDVKAAVPSQPANDLRYTATSGDTVSKLAGAFLGSDDQAHQDTIIDANASLKADPDRLVAGKTYRIPAPDGLSATAAPSPANVAPRPTTQPDSDQIITAGSPRILRYTARAGDSVTTLAIQLLGSDTQDARDTIINNNPSLKLNPDRLIAGQTYSIPAPAAVGQPRS